VRQDLEEALAYVHKHICGKLRTVGLIDCITIPPICPDDLVSVVVDLLADRLLRLFPFAVQSFSGFRKLRFLLTSLFGFGLHMLICSSLLFFTFFCSLSLRKQAWFEHFPCTLVECHWNLYCGCKGFHVEQCRRHDGRIQLRTASFNIGSSVGFHLIHISYASFNAWLGDVWLHGHRHWRSTLCCIGPRMR